MSKQALGAFEFDSSTDDWVCFRSTSVNWNGLSVPVAKGQRFHPHTTFAGHDDFTAHLSSIAVDAPSIAPHETT